MHKSSFFKPSNANNNNPSSNAWQIVGKRQNQNHNLAEKTPQSYDERFPTLLADHLKECPFDDPENLSVFLIVLENPLMLRPASFHVAIERVRFERIYKKSAHQT